MYGKVCINDGNYISEDDGRDGKRLELWEGACSYSGDPLNSCEMASQQHPRDLASASHQQKGQDLHPSTRPGEERPSCMFIVA